MLFLLCIGLYHVFFQYIPCNVRGFLGDYIQEHWNIATTFKHKRTEPAILTYEIRSYASDFKHRGNYSKFCGSAWFEFSNDYALRAEDRLVFTLDNSCFDLKVETFRDGERILPLPSVGEFLFFCMCYFYHILFISTFQLHCFDR